jgi:hypothetical protein
MAEWICPCNGCKKARLQAFKEIEEIYEKWKGDMNLTWFEVNQHINKELYPKKDKK